MDKDAFYFPHFCNARHDRKIKRLRKELGVEGYGIFFMLLEVLREQKDYKYPVVDIDILADEFGTSEQKTKVVIFNYNLFEIDADENFFSPKFNEFMQPYLKMKAQRVLAGQKSAIARGNRLIESTTVERPLNKGKESKVNKETVTEKSLVVLSVDFFKDKGIEESLIQKAIDIAKEKGKGWNYAKGILDNCLKDNIYTLNKFLGKSTGGKPQRIMYNENCELLPNGYKRNIHTNIVEKIPNWEG